MSFHNYLPGFLTLILHIAIQMIGSAKLKMAVLLNSDEPLT